jgi:hypothetical protein
MRLKFTLKYKTFIKLFVLSFVLICRVYGDTIQAEVVVLLYGVSSRQYICKLNYFYVLCNTYPSKNTSPKIATIGDRNT